MYYGKNGHICGCRQGRYTTGHEADRCARGRVHSETSKENRAKTTGQPSSGTRTSSKSKKNKSKKEIKEKMKKKKEEPKEYTACK